MFSEGFVARINLEIKQIKQIRRQQECQQEFIPQQTSAQVEDDVIAIKVRQNISVLYTETPNLGVGEERIQRWRRKGGKEMTKILMGVRVGRKKRKVIKERNEGEMDKQ